MNAKYSWAKARCQIQFSVSRNTQPNELRAASCEPPVSLRLLTVHFLVARFTIFNFFCIYAMPHCKQLPPPPALVLWASVSSTNFLGQVQTSSAAYPASQAAIQAIQSWAVCLAQHLYVGNAFGEAAVVPLFAFLFVFHFQLTDRVRCPPTWRLPGRKVQVCALCAPVHSSELFTF